MMGVLTMMATLLTSCERPGDVRAHIVGKWEEIRVEPGIGTIEFRSDGTCVVRDKVVLNGRYRFLDDHDLELFLMRPEPTRPEHSAVFPVMPRAPDTAPFTVKVDIERGILSMKYPEGRLYGAYSGKVERYKRIE